MQSVEVHTKSDPNGNNLAIDMSANLPAQANPDAPREFGWLRLGMGHGDWRGSLAR